MVALCRGIRTGRADAVGYLASLGEAGFAARRRSYGQRMRDVDALHFAEAPAQCPLREPVPPAATLLTKRSSTAAQRSRRQDFVLACGLATPTDYSACHVAECVGSRLIGSYTERFWAVKGPRDRYQRPHDLECRLNVHLASCFKRV